MIVPAMNMSQAPETYTNMTTMLENMSDPAVCSCLGIYAPPWSAVDTSRCGEMDTERCLASLLV